MKQLLLFLGILCLVLTVRAQAPTPRLRLSEFYISPNPNKSTVEFFELGNYSGVPESTDDYLLVTYFERDRGAVKGFYLIDLPHLTVAPGGVVVVSAGNAAALNSSYNWNDTTNPRVAHASFKKFLLNGNGSAASLDSSGIVTADRNDIFVVANDNLMMLFKKKNGTFKLMDGLIAGSSNPIIPNYVVNIQAVLSFYFTGASGVPERSTLDFGEYRNKTIENLVTPASGSDNGYTFCSSWKKSASPTSFTPGAMNIFTNNTSSTGSPVLLTPIADIALDSLAFTLSGGIPANYPVTVSLYKDLGATATDPVPDLDFSGTVDQLLATKTVKTATSVPINIYPTPPVSTKYWLVIVGGECTRKLPYFFDVAFENLVLPVTFAQFQGVRTGNEVAVSWETASESNNKGFYLQRQTGGAWNNLAFVGSKAPGGSSSQALSYAFTDNNPAEGNSLYRLLQEDRDGKTSYSTVISVEGTTQTSGVKVLANPGMAGRVQVVLEGSTVLRNVVVSDLSGRVLKRYRSVSSGSLQVDGLQAGMYFVVIQDVRTGKQVTEKVLVSR
ncbi:T9SS type A sorting domain-containing protein [Paraflavisolibacter sp. H34]|uniref:T9SS type A sorting domain-containing protein n=1 Tax=Huijunlia imazamoxiresistens TaxID=3127457 RepID=UPI003016C719